MENNKPKKISWIAIIIAIVIIILGCAFAYGYFTKTWIFKEKPVSTKPLYALKDYLKVDASTATQPLALAFTKNFTGQDVTLESMSYTQTDKAYERLINGEVDLILVTQPSDEELALAKSKGFKLEVIPVVREGFVFFVNAKNKVSNLTVSQIQKIYSGTITNWSQVGGEDLAIKAYQRPVNSGSQTGMLKLVMKNKKMMIPPKEYIADGMYDVVNLVSIYNNQESAIGYSYYYYTTTMFQNIDSKIVNNIKLLSVNKIKPNNETIKDGTYPFTTSYYIVINKASAKDSPVRKLANLMLSKRGQNVALGANYVPIK